MGIMYLSPETREKIKRREEKRLAKYKKELLEISAILKAALALPSPD